MKISHFLQMLFLVPPNLSHSWPKNAFLSLFLRLFLPSSPPIFPLLTCSAEQLRTEREPLAPRVSLSNEGAETNHRRSGRTVILSSSLECVCQGGLSLMNMDVWQTSSRATSLQLEGLKKQQSRPAQQVCEMSLAAITRPQVKT